MKTLLKRTLIASSIALTLSTPAVQAALVTDLYGPFYFSTAGANFTMLASNGGVVGGTNDVSLLWDGDGYTASSDYTGPGIASNVTMTATTPFFGHTWTAHDIQVFTPGSYSFDTTLGGGTAEAGTLSATVGAGQLGMHMLFDWNGGNNIDVFVVLQTSSQFGAGLLYSTQTNTKGQSKCDASFTGGIVKNCLFDGGPYGAGAPIKNQVWMMASTDPDGDGVNGVAMAAGGPFQGYNANFNATLHTPPVPIPGAVWLFGSGLMGLVATARRKKRA